MKRFLFYGLCTLASAVWLVLLFEIVGTTLRLSAYRQLEMRDILPLVIPLVGFSLVVWIGFGSRKRMSRPAAFVLELVLGALGVLFLTEVQASRAG
ncbi:MAG: hypothetical protein ACJ8EQ_00745 [Sphingomicrobium sp.]